MVKKFLLIVFVLSIVTSMQPFKLNRVIVSTDAHPNYIQFWPIVARTWQKIGLRPTLALIGDSSVTVDTSLGDVVRFNPIPGVPTSLQAQVIRVFLPALYPNDFCLISDIDMIPLSRKYFTKAVHKARPNAMVVFRDHAYGKDGRYPMCYNAARGRTFGEIFNIHSKEDIDARITQWSKEGYGWNTDEIIMTRVIKGWSGFKSRCIRLGHKVTRRIDRGINRNEKLLGRGYYIDFHAPRPYHEHKNAIDRIVSRAIKRKKKRHRIEEIQPQDRSWKGIIMSYSREIKDTLGLLVAYFTTEFDDEELE